MDTREWKEFLLWDYFEIVAGIYHYPDEYDLGDTPYVSACTSDNSVGQFIDLEPEFPGNCIVTGKVGCNAFYQPDPFCATSDVNVFIPRFEMNYLIAMFLVTVINYGENYRWAYGRQCRVGDSKEIKVMLPASDIDEPDWQWMESFILALDTPCITTSVSKSNMALDTNLWSEFTVDELFVVINGKGITKDEIAEHPGFLAAVQSGEDNFGILGFIDRDYCVSQNYAVWEDKCLTVARSGTSGFVAYHKNGCVVGDSAKILVLKQHNARTPLIYLFMRTILEANRYKYSYGRKVTTAGYEGTILKLPVTSDGDPNWRWMEDYMKSLPYSDRIPT